MPWLRKYKRSPFWIGIFELPNGKRTTRSTKVFIWAPTAQGRKENRDIALEIVLKWELTSLKAKQGNMTATQAREVVNEILKIAGVEELDSVTPRDFFKSWLEGKNNEGTNERYTHTTELFMDHLNGLADGAMSKVSYKEILAFMKKRKDAGMAPKTIRTDVKSLSNAFNLARKLGHISVNPVEQALALQPIDVQSSTKGVFTPTQVAQIVGTAEGDWHTASLLGYYTGGRLRDCANLRAGQIDWVNGVIAIRQRKTGKTAWIPIHACLARHLSKAVEGLAPDDFVCPTLANRKTGGKTGLSREFAAIMRKAGIDQCLGAGQGKRRFSKLSFHSLRHSFNSHLANLGVDQETRQIMIGHGTKEANDDYTHLDLPKLRGGVGLLPDVDGGAQEVSPAQA